MSMANDDTLPTPSSDSTVTVRFGSGDDTTTPRFSVGYWGMRGLGAPLRMMLCAARTDFVCHMYDSVEDTETTWKSSYSIDKEAFVQHHPFMNLPFVIDSKEKLFVTQSNACFQYLGEQLGQMGQTLAERTMCVQLLCEVYDLRDVMVNFAYRCLPDEAANTVAATRKPFGKFNQHFQMQTSALALSSSTDASETPLFTVGRSMTAPDFHLFEMIDQFDVLCRTFGLEDCCKDFPHVRAFHTAFAKHEANQFYLTSLFHKDLPLNNPYAHFGSAADGTSYCRGKTETPWRKLGDITLRAETAEAP